MKTDTHKARTPKKIKAAKPNQHLRDCEKLSATALRTKYRAEANSHRAMLSREKLGLAVVAAELRDFRSYLSIVGPLPRKGHTMDRLNNADPEYAPGKIEWRSKQEQSRNRSNVIHLKDFDGTTRPLTEWAVLKKQSRHTLHARKRRGWSDPEVIHGRNQASSKTSHQGFPWPKGSEALWEAGYRRGAWMLSGRRELRAEFLLRISRNHYQELMESVERLIQPGTEVGPEHDDLFKKVHGWRRELRRAAALLAQPGYRE